MWQDGFFSGLYPTCNLVEWSPWWWKQQGPVKRRYTSTKLHGATFQNIIEFLELSFLKNWCLLIWSEPPGFLWNSEVYYCVYKSQAMNLASLTEPKFSRFSPYINFSMYSVVSQVASPLSSFDYNFVSISHLCLAWLLLCLVILDTVTVTTFGCGSIRKSLITVREAVSLHNRTRCLKRKAVFLFN